MAKAICYEEYCDVSDKIHLRNWIVLGLSAAVIVAAIVVTNTIFSDISLLNLPIYPPEF